MAAKFHFIARKGRAALSPLSCQRPSLLLLGLLLGLLSLLPPPLRQAQAQPEQGYAAALHILNTGVAVRRAGTTRWIELPLNAVAVFGEGDELRTDAYGRALLEYEGVQTLILPASTYRIEGFTLRDGQLSLHAFVEGRSVHRVPQPARFADYQLQSRHTLITQPAQHFALQSLSTSQAASQPQAPSDYVIVAAGEAALRVEGMAAGLEIIVLPGYGLRIEQGGRVSEPVALQQPPFNFARVESALEGCPAVVATKQNVELRVRSGPGFDFYTLGALPPGTPIEVMGLASFTGEAWYRIQFLNDFGWVLADEIQSRCDALPTYELDDLGDYPATYYLQARELPLLEPFFMSPAFDKWFYQRPLFSS